MSGDKKFTKFPDLPSIDWTIVQIEYDGGTTKRFQGLNTRTQERTPEYPTYGEALKDAEHREWVKKP